MLVNNLKQFDLTIRYVPGNCNLFADTLSRDIDKSINALTLRSQKAAEYAKVMRKNKIAEVLVPSK